MTLESDILKKIEPSLADDKKVKIAVEELIEKVVDEAERIDAHMEPMLVGSVAKCTHLKNPDIDLFMLFPESTTPETLKEVGLKIGRAVLGGREHYAQHPYVRGTYQGFQVDLVPAFRIRDTRKKMSAVDRTPFHTEFVRKNLARDEVEHVRLLKMFMKGIECYGAEAKVQGFSGYLCELLVMRFGDFREVLRAASGWKVGEAIELPGYPGNEFEETLTFIDPVDPSRNVASAVAMETMLRFVMASREYLASPDEKFFFPAERGVWDLDRLALSAGDRLGNLVSISFPKPDLIDDILYPQLRKSLSSAAALLERNDFEVEKTTMHVDGWVHLLIELESASLPMQRKHRGPPVNSENASEFLAKWRTLGISEPYVEDGRWFVQVKREHERAADLLKAKLKEMTLGKDIRKVDQLLIENGDDVSSERHLPALTRHFDERMPWER